MRPRAMARQGFTLVELLLSLIVAAIVGAALLRLMLGQTRFMDQQEAWREARGVSRSGINRLLSDLRAVENGSGATGGLQAAAAGGQDFTIRVPYAFGVICSHLAAVTTVSLLPVDDAMYNEPGFSGFAWRDAEGVYSYHTGVTIGAGTAANCQNPGPDSIHTLPSINGSPAGRRINLVALALAPVPPRGSIMFLYRRIRYEFKASAAVPGRIGLWRTTLDGIAPPEELAAPFDATARVNFYVLNSATAQADVPAQLSTVRGLELVLNGMSERTPGGSDAPKSANVTTSVFFENRPD
jgi:prepilin-type N-terminal cleavage/methylation domain-containing protein